MVTKLTHELNAVVQQIATTLQMRHDFCSANPDFQKFCDQNDFWRKNFSGAQLESGIYSTRSENGVYSSDFADKNVENLDALVRLAERAKQQLIEDFNAYSKREEETVLKAIGSTIKTQDDEVIEVNKLLDFYRTWGYKTAGLIELYSVIDEDRINLRFDGWEGLPELRREVGNTTGDIMKIYQIIVERQDEIAEARQRNSAMPSLVLAVAKAYQEGLPQNYQAKFSWQGEDYTDCFVLTADGEQRAPDQIYNAHGNPQPQMLLGLNPIATSGTKVWRQIMCDELVIKVHRTYLPSTNGHRELDRHRYTFETVVSPRQTSAKQQEGKKELAKLFYEQIANDDIRSNNDTHCRWENSCTKTFVVDSFGKIVQSETLYYAPQCFYRDNILINLQDEEIAASASKYMPDILTLMKGTEASPEKTTGHDESAAIKQEFQDGKWPD